MSKSENIKIFHRLFHLINFKSALAAGFCLEFHDPSTFGTKPPFTILRHHPSDSGSLYSFGTVKCIQVMPFDLLFGMFLDLRAWKLAAASTVAEILRIKTCLDFAFQAGFGFAVITDETSCAWVLVFFAADAVDSAWCKQF